MFDLCVTIIKNLKEIDKIKYADLHIKLFLMNCLLLWLIQQKLPNLLVFLNTLDV